MSHSPFSLATTGTLAESLARMFAYDRHANTVVLDAFDSLGDRLPEKPLARLCHIIICKQLWIARMGGSLPMPADIFPLWPLDEARSRNEETAQAVDHALRELDETKCRATFDYISTEGDRYRSSRADIFMQLLLHGSYHRGQIAMEVNPLLKTPLVTDFVYETRMAIE